MSNKYIIKNCEQIHSADNFCWSKNALCSDCTDCVMKQILELCKKAPILDADWILNKLNIQEVE